MDSAVKGEESLPGGNERSRSRSHWQQRLDLRGVDRVVEQYQGAPARQQGAELLGRFLEPDRDAVAVDAQRAKEPADRLRRGHCSDSCAEAAQVNVELPVWESRRGRVRGMHSKSGLANPADAIDGNDDSGWTSGCSCEQSAQPSQL